MWGRLHDSSSLSADKSSKKRPGLGAFFLSGPTALVGGKHKAAAGPRLLISGRQVAACAASEKQADRGPARMSAGLAQGSRFKSLAAHWGAVANDRPPLREPPACQLGALTFPPTVGHPGPAVLRRSCSVGTHHATSSRRQA